MKAVVEEGDESLAARMQHLALSEAALPRHLLTAFYTKKRRVWDKYPFFSPFQFDKLFIFLFCLQDLSEMVDFY